MKHEFKQIAVTEITDNMVKLIGNDWMLITAGTIDKFNTMTASWGGLGVLWGKQASFCFVRPTRYTYGFMEKTDKYSLVFFKEKYKKQLNYCGSHSGRNVDKIKETGLTPVKSANGIVYFQESYIVLECRKLYYQDINPANFVDAEINKNYPEKDYHRMYVGEIINCMIQP